MPKTNKKMKTYKKILIGILIFIIVLSGAFYIYTLDYYRASGEVSKMEEVKNAVSIGNMLIFNSDSQNTLLNKTGIIFYPGGKVEAIAYAPLLIKLSNAGITCVLIKMPMNLAVFNINGADKVYEEFPNIEKWYLMGHSLGGAMASSYVEKNSSKLEGLILLGAYPVNESDLETLVIYGSEDLGLDTDKLEGVKLTYKLEGGNHAYFGNYGEQKGDGIASISREEQQNSAIGIIIDFITSKSE